jgi:hypothetical protein
MCSVPPDTGVDDEVLVVGEDVDDELHAARAMAASTAAASPAERLGVLIMGMFLLVRKANKNEAAIWRPTLLITTYQERLCASGTEIQTNAAVVARL